MVEFLSSEASSSGEQKKVASRLLRGLPRRLMNTPSDAPADSSITQLWAGF